MVYTFTEDEYARMAIGLHNEAADHTIGQEDWVAIAKAGIAAVNQVDPPSVPAKSFHSYWVNWNGYKPSDAEVEREAKRRSYVMLNAWDHVLAGKLKSYNPALKVFCYKDASSTRSYDSNTDYRLLPTGVSYQYANTYRTNWFLKDRNGNRLSYSGYNGHWQMDIGHVDYQKEWASNVAKMKQQWPVWDGILVDNLLWTPDTYHSGVVPMLYGTETAFQDAYKYFLSTVGPVLRNAGLSMLGNLSNARIGNGGRWLSYMAYLDGGWDEWWLTFSNTNILSEYTEGWTRQVSEITSNDLNGKMTLVQPHHTYDGNGNRAFTYALASYYMGIGTNTKAAFSPISQTDGYDAPTPWYEEMSWDLGQPLGVRSAVKANVWIRRFEKGVVVVNANVYGSNSAYVDLGGTYVSKWGSLVSSVTLIGCQGAIFRKA